MILTIENINTKNKMSNLAALRISLKVDSFLEKAKYCNILKKTKNALNVWNIIWEF